MTVNTFMTFQNVRLIDQDNYEERIYLCFHYIIQFPCQDHLAIHRPANYCHPFIVKRDPDVGRLVSMNQHRLMNMLHVTDTPWLAEISSHVS